MKPLFVSFAGRKNGQEAQGWIVLPDQPPLTVGIDVANMANRIEDIRRYDPGTLVVIGFRRLEDDHEQRETNGHR